MLGFVNGLAIVIFLAQLSQFQVPGTAEHAGHGMANGEWLSGLPLAMMLGLVALTMVIIWLMPRITNIVPAPLAGIAVTAAIVIALGLDVPRVGDMASIEGGLPMLHIPVVPLTWETLEIILPYAVILAAIGLIESLLTLNLVGEMTGKRGGASRECVAQGAANTVTGFFGGMGGCAMIGQSMINVKSGGRTRLAGIAAALFLLTFILFAAPLIEQIPLAALVGVMFMVVIGTFAWNSLRILTKVPRTDAFVTILVTIVTVATDLATAVVVGVIVSALAYAWQNATRIYATTYRTPENAKVYKVQGPLFFGSAEGFVELFQVADDPQSVIVDFEGSRVVDQSALQAIENVASKYEAAGKRIQLRHLSRDCHQLLSRAGHLVVDSDDDPDYQLAVDYSVRTGIIGGH
jgi:SulP family sulfate permease